MGLGWGIGDPRSGIRKKPIPDPGSQIQGHKLVIQQELCMIMNVIHKSTAEHFDYEYFYSYVDFCLCRVGPGSHCHRSCC
jgi:hypothetical protein